MLLSPFLKRAKPARCPMADSLELPVTVLYYCCIVSCTKDTPVAVSVGAAYSKHGSGCPLDEHKHETCQEQQALGARQPEAC